MKQLFLIALTAFSSFAFGSSHVCSGEQLYASDVRLDSGPRPMPGTVIGTHVIVYEGIVLQQYEDIAGLFPHGVPPYQVSYERDQKVLEEISEPAYMEKTYTVTAILNQVDSMTGKVLKEIGRENVVCRDIQKFVP